MGLERLTVYLGENNRPVECIRSAELQDREGYRKPTLIFEHSWNIPPFPDYRELLEALDQWFAVHALTKNMVHDFVGSPVTIRDFAGITREYVDHLDREQQQEVHLLGHSMGFATALEAARMIGPRAKSLVGISPLLPGKHSVARFSLRFLWMSAGMLIGSTGARGRTYLLRSALSYPRRALRNPTKSITVLRELARVRFDEEPCSVPTCVIRSAVDELVPYTPATAAEVRRAFTNSSERLMGERYDRHSVPVLFGKRAAKEILAQYRAWGILSEARSVAPANDGQNE